MFTFEEFEATKGTYEMAARSAARQRAIQDALAADECPREPRVHRWMPTPRVRMPHWPRPLRGQAMA